MSCGSEVDCGDGRCDDSSEIPVCVCNAGFFASSEFIFDDNLEIVPCNTNIAVFTTLYVFAALWSVANLFLYLRSVKRLSQLKRLVPFFVALLIFIILPFIKISMKDDANVGEELGVTIAFALVLLIAIVAQWIWLRKFIAVQIKIGKVKSIEHRTTVKRIHLFLRINVALALISTVLVIITPFVSRKSASALFKAAFVGFAIGASITWYSMTKLINTMVDDIQIISASQWRKNMISKNFIGSLASTRITVAIYFVIFILGFSNDFLLEQWKYLFPVYIYSSNIGTCFTLLYNNSTKKLNTIKSGNVDGSSERRRNLERQLSTQVSSTKLKKASFVASFSNGDATNTIPAL